MEIVVATKNKKKLAELQRILKDTGVHLLGLDSFPNCPEVEETGSTFAENAVKKAKEVAAFTGLPAIADDSGLEVYALGGAPGVYSARYSGEGATDKSNIEKLLKELGNVAEENRGARFVCVIALAMPDGEIRIFEGHVEGKIGREPRGEYGFGYDPVFFPEGHTRTFAEMSAEEKDSMSHRGRALEKLKQYLLGR